MVLFMLVSLATLAVSARKCMSTGERANGTKLPCVFPWIQDARTFSKCIRESKSKKPWCSTAISGSSNTTVAWDYCETSCDAMDCPDGHTMLRNGVCACPHGSMLENHVCVGYSGVCMTSGSVTSGYKHACVFPFIWKRVKYTSCAVNPDLTGSSVCALAVDLDGVATATDACDMHKCSQPLDGWWKEWSTCSISCGNGGIRQRTCGSVKCSGIDHEMCTMPPCPTWSTPFGPHPIDNSGTAPGISTGHIPLVHLVFIGVGFVFVILASVYMFQAGQSDRSHSRKKRSPNCGSSRVRTRGALRSRRHG